MALLRPPCRLGSSLTLTRVLVAYRSWNAAGKGGMSEGVLFLRGFLAGGGELSADDSDSESEYSTKAILFLKL